MPKTKLGQAPIPKFSSESEEAEWWDAHRAEIEVDIRARLTNLAERTPADIDKRAATMRPAERRRADSETRKISKAVEE